MASTYRHSREIVDTDDYRDYREANLGQSPSADIPYPGSSQVGAPARAAASPCALVAVPAH